MTNLLVGYIVWNKVDQGWWLMEIHFTYIPFLFDCELQKLQVRTREIFEQSWLACWSKCNLIEPTWTFSIAISIIMYCWRLFIINTLHNIFTCRTAVTWISATFKTFCELLEIPQLIGECLNLDCLPFIRAWIFIKTVITFLWTSPAE